MSADLKKRLAEAFRAFWLANKAPIPSDLTMVDGLARIAAEEIEKARMDAARKVRDAMQRMSGEKCAYASDEWIARIIGAGSHEGGGEVSAAGPEKGGPEVALPDEAAYSAPVAEPPRPDFAIEFRSLALEYAQGLAAGRAAAFEECAKIAELTAYTAGMATSVQEFHAKNIAAAIRAAARKEKM